MGNRIVSEERKSARLSKIMARSFKPREFETSTGYRVYLNPLKRAALHKPYKNPEYNMIMTTAINEVFKQMKAQGEIEANV